MAGETLVELVARIKADATQLERGLTDAERKTEASSKKMADSLKKVGVAMAASGAAITAALGLMGKAAIDEEINIKRLATTINNSGTAYDSVKDSMEALIATTQRKTGIADNDQRDILGRLVLITQDYGKALELLPTVLDLAAVGEMDASTAATYLGKAFLDLQDGAEEVTVRFGQASLQFKSMEDIQNRVAGAAENLANPLSVLKASIGDVAEAIGANLIPMIKGASDKIVDIAIKVKEWVEEHPALAKVLTVTALTLGVLLTAIGGALLIIPKLISAFITLRMVAIAANLALGPIGWAIGAISIALIALVPLMIDATNSLDQMALSSDRVTISMGNLTQQFADSEVALNDYMKRSGTAINSTSKAVKNLTSEVNANKQAIGYATWTADGYTYSMQLFTQAEIDAAKASGKKIEELKTQSEVTEENTEKAKAYKEAIDDTSKSVDTFSTSLQDLFAQLARIKAETGGLTEEEILSGARTRQEAAREQGKTARELQKEGWIIGKEPPSGYQHGGIITKPTLALMGEKAPAIKEAVIPETMWGELGGKMMTIILELDGRILSRAVMPYATEEIRLRSGIR